MSTSGEPIVVTGCGTSEHGAMAIAELLDAALRQRGARGGRVEVRQALEAALDPRPGGLCIAVTESGGTRATLLAVESARDAGSATATITANPGGAVIDMVDVAMVTPQRDKSWCHTVAFTSAILAGAALAAEIAEVDLAGTEIANWLAQAVAPGEVEHTIADGMRDLTVLQTVGSGADRVTARELALKIEEGARRPAVARDLETLLHGHFVACGPNTGLIVILTDGRSGERRWSRAARGMGAAARLGMPVAGIFSPDTARAVPENLTPAGRMVLPTGEDPLPPLRATRRGRCAAVPHAGYGSPGRRESGPYPAGGVPVPRSRGAGRGSPGLVKSAALRRHVTGSTRTAPLDSVPSVTIRPTPPAGNGSSSMTSATVDPSIWPIMRVPCTVSDIR